MLDRLAQGSLPAKHHIAHREGEALLHEECLTRQGFEGAYTILYHQRRPHAQIPITLPPDAGFVLPRAAEESTLRKRHYLTPKTTPGSTPLGARIPLLFNSDVTLSVIRPTQSDTRYFLNGDGDDLFYVFEGGGIVRSVLGDLRFEKDDYVCIPKGTLHRIVLEEGLPQHWFHIECFGGLGLLKQWRNETGQLRMDAPYCHRDFRRTEWVGPLDESIREVVVKRAEVGTGFHGFRYEGSPLDAVGWDGTVYPWAFPILNFQPRAGLVHLPPDWHGTFATRGALICSFVPRAVDFHPEAIPCPYPHSSVDCDEVLFYSRGNFTSRRGVGPGSVSFHPRGIAHGPHPGAYEASIGHRETNELAVMLDTFSPLIATPEAHSIEDMSYQESFL